LHGLTFDVRLGETLGGDRRVGLGKSTMLRAPGGARETVFGEVHIKGVDITKAGARGNGEIRKRIGLAFQGGALNRLDVRRPKNISLPPWSILPSSPALSR